MDSWSHHQYRLQVLGDKVKALGDRVSNDNPSLPPMLLNSLLDGVDPDFSQHGIESLVVANRALFDNNFILYWWPLDTQHLVVFVTASPIRRWFSFRYVRLYVTVDGKVSEMDSQQFFDLMKRSKEYQKNVLNEEK